MYISNMRFFSFGWGGREGGGREKINKKKN